MLGVERTASMEEIRAAYRKLALKWHPDRVPAEEKEVAKEQFQIVADAYQTLSDPVTREQYDNRGPGTAPLSEETAVQVRRPGGMSAEELFRNEFEDLFRNVTSQTRAAEGDRTTPMLAWGAAGSVAGGVLGVIFWAPAALPLALLGGAGGIARGYTDVDAATNFANLDAQTRKKTLEMLFRMSEGRNSE